MFPSNFDDIIQGNIKADIIVDELKSRLDSFYRQPMVPATYERIRRSIIEYFEYVYHNDKGFHEAVYPIPFDVKVTADNHTHYVQITLAPHPIWSSDDIIDQRRIHMWYWLINLLRNRGIMAREDGRVMTAMELIQESQEIEREQSQQT